MIITVCSIVLVSAVFCNAFAGIFRSVLSRDEQMEETIAKLSEEAMDTQIRSALTKSATDNAMIADAFMEKAIEKIRIIADAAAMAYEGADTYPGREIPLHISRFFPRYHMTDRTATDIGTVYALVRAAEQHLKYVHPGNC